MVNYVFVEGTCQYPSYFHIVFSFQKLSAQLHFISLPKWVLIFSKQAFLLASQLQQLQLAFKLVFTQQLQLVFIPLLPQVFQ